MSASDPVSRIRDARFAAVRLREGYEMNAVGAPATTTPPTSVIREQRGLLSRLFRRNQ